MTRCQHLAPAGLLCNDPDRTDAPTTTWCEDRTDCRRERTPLVLRRLELRHDKTHPPRPKIGPWINDQEQGATTMADEQKNAPTAANLAESLRAMRRSAGRHIATRGGMQWSVVLDDIRIGDLTDAAGQIEALEMALNAEHAQRITLQHHAADLAQRVDDLERALEGIARALDLDRGAGPEQIMNVLSWVA